MEVLAPGNSTCERNSDMQIFIRERALRAGSSALERFSAHPEATAATAASGIKARADRLAEKSTSGAPRRSAAYNLLLPAETPQRA